MDGFESMNDKLIALNDSIVELKKHFVMSRAVSLCIVNKFIGNFNF